MCLAGGEDGGGWADVVWKRWNRVKLEKTELNHKTKTPIFMVTEDDKDPNWLRRKMPLYLVNKLEKLTVPI